MKTARRRSVVLARAPRFRAVVEQVLATYIYERRKILYSCTSPARAACPCSVRRPSMSSLGFRRNRASGERTSATWSSPSCSCRP